MKPTLEQSVIWAKQAGAILREGYAKTHQIHHKGQIDLTTEVDHQSEAYLIEQIHQHFPGHTIDTEESGLLPGQGKAIWYIDPLDGTTNYAHAVPYFAVSLAYTEDGSTCFGVVYDPMRDECFTALAGQGAWLNEQTIHVSQTADLIHSLMLTGFPYVQPECNLAAFGHFTRRTQGVRRMGAAALDLCYIAAGRCDGYWEQTLRPWDFAAGALIAQEAGGCVTTLKGAADLFTPPYAILAGNPRIHAQMVNEFQQNQETLIA